MSTYRLPRKVGSALLLPGGFHLRLIDGSIAVAGRYEESNKLGAQVLTGSIDSVLIHKGKIS